MPTQQITTLGIKVQTTGAAKAKRAVAGIGKTADKTRKQVRLLKGVLTGAAGLFAAKVIKDAIKYTASIEDLRIQLKFLTGSTKNASKAFSEMTKFASETPFALQDIQKSSASLLVAVGNDVDKLGDILKITGEISAQFGLTFIQTAEQLQRAMSAGISSADLFREKGVAAMIGFRAGVKVSIEDTESMIKDWAKDNSGAIEELKDTFNGKVSMMGDAWDNLLLTFGEAGVLDVAKEAVQAMTDNLKDPGTVTNVKNLAKGLREIVEIIKTIETFGDDLWEFLQLDHVVKNLNNLGNLMWDDIGKAITDIGGAVGMLDESASSSMDSFRKSMAQNSEFAKSEREKTAEALKLEMKQWSNVAKITQKVFTVTSKLTKKRTELEKITGAQTTAEKLLGQQLKASKITQEQYNDGIKRMQVEIQEYHKIVEQIGLDKQMAKISKSMEDSITTALLNMGQGLNSFKDLATGIFRGIALEMVRINISRPIANFASSFLSSAMGSLFGAPVNNAPISDLRPPTFTGGGFTGGGSRTGGVDGKGGFPAILHPNETVLDHAQGQKLPSKGNTTINHITVDYSPQVNALDPRTAAIVIAENAPTVVGIIRQAFDRNGRSISI